MRKLRWAAKAKGKSGGVRIIYYYYNSTKPLLLLHGFAKNEMENLNKADTNALKKMLPYLIAHHKGGIIR